MRRASAVLLREPEARMAPQSLHPKIRSLQLDLGLKRRFAAACEGGGLGERGKRGEGKGLPLPPCPRRLSDAPRECRGSSFRGPWGGGLQPPPLSPPNPRHPSPDRGASRSPSAGSGQAPRRESGAEKSRAFATAMRRFRIQPLRRSSWGGLTPPPSRSTPPTRRAEASWHDLAQPALVCSSCNRPSPEVIC